MSSAHIIHVVDQARKESTMITLLIALAATVTMLIRKLTQK